MMMRNCTDGIASVFDAESAGLALRPPSCATRLIRQQKPQILHGQALSEFFFAKNVLG
jgi:hypothetical protein